MNLLPLFLVSLAAAGIETALTRYFAVASWSDYGYWIISIVMAGLALSGVTLALAREALVKRADLLLAALPTLLVLSAALGYCGCILNPFNPLQLQNPVTYLPQLGNVGLYYLALLPFFFLAGLFISLSFVINAGKIGKVYAADLTGAGIGSFLVLGLMFLVAPFALCRRCCRRWRWPAALPIATANAPPPALRWRWSRPRRCCCWGRRPASANTNPFMRRCTRRAPPCCQGFMRRRVHICSWMISPSG